MEAIHRKERKVRKGEEKEFLWTRFRSLFSATYPQFS